jgi:hypothetical protein
VADAELYKIFALLIRHRLSQSGKRSFVDHSVGLIFFCEHTVSLR